MYCQTQGNSILVVNINWYMGQHSTWTIVEVCPPMVQRLCKHISNHPKASDWVTMHWNVFSSQMPQIATLSEIYPATQFDTSLHFTSVLMVWRCGTSTFMVSDIIWLSGYQIDQTESLKRCQEPRTIVPTIGEWRLLCYMSSNVWKMRHINIHGVRYDPAEW